MIIKYNSELWKIETPENITSRDSLRLFLQNLEEGKIHIPDSDDFVNVIEGIFEYQMEFLGHIEEGEYFDIE